MTHHAQPLNSIVASQLLDVIQNFTSDERTMCEKGQSLSFDQTMSKQIAEGVSPIDAFGHHSYGISEGCLDLPGSLTWKQLQQAGVVQSDDGLLRIDLVRNMASTAENV